MPGVACCDRAVGAERGLEACERFQRGVGTVPFICGEDRRPLVALDRQRLDLFPEPSRSLRRGESLLALRSKGVLGFARDAVLLHQVLRVPAGMFAGKRVVQSVEQQRIHGLGISHARAEAHAGQQVGRAVHVLDTAGDHDARNAGEHFRIRGRDTLGTGAADAVHGHGWHAHRQAPVDRRLSGHIHAIAGLHDVAHHDGIHPGRVEAGAAQYGGDGMCAQCGCRCCLERSTETGDGAAHGGTDDDVFAHDVCPWLLSGWNCGAGLSMKAERCLPVASRQFPSAGKLTNYRLLKEADAVAALVSRRWATFAIGRPERLAVI